MTEERFRSDDTVWDVIFRALSDQYRHPERNGGGMIGKTQAVIKALGIDGDAPVSRVRPRP